MIFPFIFLNFVLSPMKGNPEVKNLVWRKTPVLH